MADPTRLIEEDGEHGRDTVGRELLLAARREGVPPGERDRLWAAVAAAALVAPAIAVPASAASTGTAAAAGGATALAKVTVAAVVLGAASLAGYRASRPAPSPQVVARAGPRLPPPAAPEPAPEAAPPRARAAEPARVQRATAPARGLTTSHLAAEGRLVVAARRALRDGDAAGALRLLEARRAEFAGGVLEQEREALTIEALARTGRADAAAARADAFLRAYPQSPHTAAIRVFARP
jgi:hypothetical protein